MLQDWRMRRHRKALAKLQVLFLDVDGVMTNGSLHYDGAGEAIKSFNVRDGAGIKMLQALGIRVVMISGRDSAPLVARARDLGLDGSQFGVKNKGAACSAALKQWNVPPANSAFIGDDSIDLPAFEVCGIAVTVGDAPHYVKKQADIVLRCAGGQGAVREFCDMVLSASGQTGLNHSSKGFLEHLGKMGQ
jgi:3-deoxy-D-manno-octulosonate 8-phosphate phosphatase (KDO 8-P phosphatase)